MSLVNAARSNQLVLHTLDFKVYQFLVRFSCLKAFHVGHLLQWLSCLQLTEQQTNSFVLCPFSRTMANKHQTRETACRTTTKFKLT